MVHREKEKERESPFPSHRCIRHHHHQITNVTDLTQRMDYYYYYYYYLLAKKRKKQNHRMPTYLHLPTCMYVLGTPKPRQALAQLKKRSHVSSSPLLSMYYAICSQKVQVICICVYISHLSHLFTQSTQSTQSIILTKQVFLILSHTYYSSLPNQ